MANEVFIFGDVAGAVIASVHSSLTTRGDTATVSEHGYKPSSTEERPTRLVVIQRVGGTRLNKVTDRAVLTVDCYDATDAGALALAQLTRGLVVALSGTVISGLTVYGVNERAAPGRLPHPLSSNPRYTFTVEVDFRGAAE